MRKLIFFCILLLTVYAFTQLGFADDPSSKTEGAQLFNEHCAECHPKGGNIINPGRTLHKHILASHNIQVPGDIVSYMRNPGPGMPTFEKNAIPDKQAEKIAEYIMHTFNQ